MYAKIPFTKLLYNFLVKNSYTHIQTRGIEKHPEVKIGENELAEYDYILVPRKADVMQFEDAQFGLEPIEGSDVKDMLDPPNGIHFFVALPEDIGEMFAQLKKG